MKADIIIDHETQKVKLIFEKSSSFLIGKQELSGKI